MLFLLMGACMAQASHAEQSAGAWNTSLIAQGWRPGAKLGFEVPLAEREIVRTRRGIERTIDRLWLVEPSFTAWHHPGNHTPLTLGAQLYARRIRAKGWTIEGFVGQGVTYAINAGTTYEFDENDELVGSALAGRWMSATSIGFGLGRDLARSRGVDLAWHLRPTMTVWAPYNAGVAPVFTVELGVRRAWFSGGE